MLKKLILMLCIVSMMLVLGGAVFAVGDEQGPDVTAITPFTAEANFMSLPGYLRYDIFKGTGAWITRLEAVRSVKAQGADPTLSEHDMNVLNGWSQ